jgi:hypothetical protein
MDSAWKRELIRRKMRINRQRTVIKRFYLRRTTVNHVATKGLFALVIASMALGLGACSISVDDKDKKDGKVDIQTPFASLKVDSTDKAVDNGIPVYPGAHLRPAVNGDNHSANINIGAAGFGLKVIAAEYETSDSPDKVKAFYQDKMKHFGSVLVCNGHSGGSDVHIDGHNKDSDEKLSCSDTRGDGWEIKTGTSDNQHLVSIEPNGTGTRFGTVLVQTRGKQDTL